MPDKTPANAFEPQAFLRTLTSRPGVYRMLDANDSVIYVGKARNLKSRVASYFRSNLDSPKTRVLVSQIHNIEVTVTHTETEALLLENTLIKALKPRYNVYYRDDKSYPFILLSEHADFPRFGFYRGRRASEGRYFGPYPSAAAVRETLNLLQKLFPVRQCEDTFYRNRSRPCLQYQIKRCTAPCVGLVEQQRYAEDVRHAVMFLEGKSTAVIDELVERMEQAAAAQQYERAARYRDQIGALRRIQEKQYVHAGKGEIDVIAVQVAEDLACVQVFCIRGGRNLGNRSYFLRNPEQLDAASVLETFLPQYYLSGEGGAAIREIPPAILTSHAAADSTLLESVLAEKAGHAVALSANVRGERARWIKLALSNAEHALHSRLSSQSTVLQRLQALREVLKLEELPERLECFDISHTQGEATVASCVVFDQNGPLKSDYRRFNITGVTAGDDYAAMHQALSRRYRRVREEDGKLPDVLLIDGGRGQLRQALEVLEELQIGGVQLIGVAKGPGRKPGLEKLFVTTASLDDDDLSASRANIILPADSPALHLVQQIRDEAHRFAITGHRQRRQKKRSHSPLEEIPGLGPKRRQRLLSQFGGLQEVARAGVEDLASVNGISRSLAEKIYNTLHAD